MKRIISLILIVFCCTSFLFAETPTVILISFDGFRWDYANRGITPNLDFIGQHGVRASSLQPAFPSKTFPNHQSIVTGMYPENHGIIYNTIIDPFSDSKYQIGDDPANRKARWYQGEAIWETLERQGIRCASFFWPGSEIEGHRHPSLFKHYKHDEPYENRVDGVIEWLNLPANERPHFVTLYFHETDSYGHKYGPNSPEINRAIARLDAVLGRLLDGLREKGLLESTNIIVTGDHGMTEMSQERRIFVEKILTGFEYEIRASGPMMMIAPAKKQADSLIAVLKNHEKHYNVYHRNDIPDYLHFGHHPFIPEIVLIADLGWRLVKDGDRGKSLGDHGFDNHELDMHSIFMASGPSFKVGFRTGSIRNIDIYPLIIKIFSALGRQNIDGRLEAIECLLR